MALISDCPKCGGKIHKLKGVCPKCGYVAVQQRDPAKDADFTLTGIGQGSSREVSINTAEIDRAYERVVQMERQLPGMSSSQRMDAMAQITTELESSKRVVEVQRQQAQAVARAIQDRESQLHVRELKLEKVRDELRQTRETLDGRERGLEDRMSRLKGEVKGSADPVTKIEVTAEELERLISRDREWRTKEEEFDHERENLRRMQEEVVGLRTSLELREKQVEARVREKEVELQQKEGDVVKREKVIWERLLDIQRQKEALESKIKELGSVEDIAEAMEDLRKRQEYLDSEERDLAERETKLRDIKRETDTSREEIAALGREIETKRIEMHRREEEVVIREREVQDSRDRLERKEMELNEREIRVKELENRVTTMLGG